MKVKNISPFVFFDSNGVYNNYKSYYIGIRGHAYSRDAFRFYIILTWYANAGHEWQQEYFGAKNGVVCQGSGRLYDPLFGRFFSPDNYVQLPDFTQSYNRYSYCLNNPLKYTDPSGQLFGIDDALIAFSIFNAANSMIQAGMSGSNIWRAGISSLISSAASIGIGKLFSANGPIGKRLGGVSSVRHELLRAGTHGLAGGVCGLLNGGGFGSGFASGAVSSGIGSYANNKNMPLPLMFTTSSAIGGVAAWITGGDFLSGAFHGLNVALLNHGMHYDELYSDKDGNIHGHLRDLVVYYRKPNPMELGYVLSASSNAVAVADAAGKSLERNGGNSTVGNNGKFYFHADGERSFNGNQHVKVTKLSDIGKNITNITGKVSGVINAYDVGSAIALDYSNYEENGYTDGHNSIRATAGFIGAKIGERWGMIWGSNLGGYIGISFFGVGIVPGSIIGGAIGGTVGAIGGYKVGTSLVDLFY